MGLPSRTGSTMTTNSDNKLGFRGGRPKLQAQDRRKPYGVRLSARELQQVRQQAEAEGMDLSGYCRQAILCSRTQRTVPAINRKTWFELSELSEAVLSLSKQAKSGAGQPSVELLRDLSLVLKSTRLELLGVYHVQDDTHDR